MAGLKDFRRCALKVDGNGQCNVFIAQAPISRPIM